MCLDRGGPVRLVGVEGVEEGLLYPVFRVFAKARQPLLSSSSILVWPPCGPPFNPCACPLPCPLPPTSFLFSVCMRGEDVLCYVPIAEEDGVDLRSQVRVEGRRGVRRGR